MEKVRGVGKKPLPFQKPGPENGGEHFDGALGERIRLAVVGFMQEMHCHCPAVVLIPALSERIKAVADPARIDNKHRARAGPCGQLKELALDVVDDC